MGVMILWFFAPWSKVNRLHFATLQKLTRDENFLKVAFGNTYERYLSSIPDARISLPRQIDRDSLPFRGEYIPITWDFGPEQYPIPSIVFPRTEDMVLNTDTAVPGRPRKKQKKAPQLRF